MSALSPALEPWHRRLVKAAERYAASPANRPSAAEALFAAGQRLAALAPTVVAPSLADVDALDDAQASMAMVGALEDPVIDAARSVKARRAAMSRATAASRLQARLDAAADLLASRWAAIEHAAEQDALAAELESIR